MRWKIVFGLVFAAVLWMPQQTQAQSTPAQEQVSCGGVAVVYRNDSPALTPRPMPPYIAGVQAGFHAKERCAVISWKTDIPATAQVVFVEVENFAGIDATKSNLGMPYATPQNNAGETRHVVVLSDLEPGKQYWYYVLSRATVSAMPRVAGPFVLDTSLQQPVTHQIATQPKQTVPKKPDKKELQPTVPEPTTPTETPEAQASTQSTQQTTTPATTTVQSETDTAAPSMLERVPSAANALAASTLEPAWKRLWSVVGSWWQQLVGLLLPEPREKTEKPSQEMMLSEQATSTAPEKAADTPAVGGGVVKPDAPIQPTKPSADAALKEEGQTAGTGNWWGRLSFLLPTFLIVGFIWLTQKVILPHLNIVVERPRVFWLSSLLLFAVVAVLMQNFRLMFALLGLFLFLLGWHLLLQIIEEAQQQEEDVEQATNATSPESSAPKGLSHIG